MFEILHRLYAKLSDITPKQHQAHVFQFLLTLMNTLSGSNQKIGDGLSFVFHNIRNVSSKKVQ